MATKVIRCPPADPTVAANSDIGDARDALATAELPKIDLRCEDTRRDTTEKYYVDQNLLDESRHRRQLDEDEGGAARTGTGDQPASPPLPESKETVLPAMQQARAAACRKAGCRMCK